MKQNYFIANGKKYYTGSVFIINKLGKEVEASFVYYDTELQQYVYKIADSRWHVDRSHFQKWFVDTTNKSDNMVNMPVVKNLNDRHISGMFLGWMWYIFLMLIAIIFKDNIALWAMISIAFFSWRHNKIKKEGTYIEW